MGSLVSFGISAILILGYGFAAFKIGGAVEERNWLAKERSFIQKALKDKNDALEDLKRFHKLKEEASASLLNEKNKQYALLETKLTAVRGKPGGLRVSAKVCKDRGTSDGNVTGDGVPRLEESGTVRLPLQIEGDLWGAMYDAAYVTHLYTECRSALIANKLLR